MTALKTFMFWTYADESWSRAIAKLTDGPFAHMGIGFDVNNDGRVESVYFEALFHDGWTGPKPVSKLIAFRDGAAGRKLAVAYTKLTPDQSQPKLNACLQAVGVKGYHKWQLVQMLVSERFWIPVRESAERWVCSEGAARILAPELDLRDARRRRFDQVSPNSAFRRWCEITAGYGLVNAVPA
jgi:hypothetical protein